MSLNMIGLWASNEGSSCCLLQDGVVRFCGQQKPPPENKPQQLIPIEAFNFCLKSADISITDVNCITFSEEPKKPMEFHPYNSPVLTVDKIRDFFCYSGTVTSVDHQKSHAAYNYYSSALQEAAIMVIDKVGPWTLSSYGYGNGEKIEMFDIQPFPSSVAIVSSLITSYLGFKDSDEYKVMLLSNYGKPIYAEKINQLMSYMDREFNKSLCHGGFQKIITKYSEELTELLKAPPRNSQIPISNFHRDIASSMQLVYEEFFIDRAIYAYEKTNLSNLSIAGNLSRNSRANKRISTELPFKKVFVQQSCDDSICSIGAVMEGFLEETGRVMAVNPVKDFLLGPEYSDDEIEHVLKATAIEYEDYRGREEDMISFIARMLTKGKVIGWFQGRAGIGSEYSPSRLVLADSRNHNTYNKLSSALKSNDDLIPIGYVVLDKEWNNHWPNNIQKGTTEENTDEAPQFRGGMDTNSGEEFLFRVNQQYTPLLYKLMERFYSSTGYAILAASPLRLAGEENQTNLYEAIRIFIIGKIDLLIMGNFILRREKNSIPSVSWLRIQLKNL
ncbi:carbamoyltransferase N-terminal domain-containing protein [Alkaliphilus peptidifermentans]|uniref:Carbamoyltransferase n=1 Tax=Alkaliphilus peptidifermentans DSM 18978 TaxID=1120976 RepID=A0A1G5I440_9FIRM|nr:carbamoyltransferase N-terminal domain-containing protein [Alkaliphilus peptidifermentans]SCY70875.1 carbamoyltransferase [Alkaliphilus peptidifermentans DSM 18978]